jgi:hypothetical protein
MSSLVELEFILLYKNFKSIAKEILDKLHPFLSFYFYFLYFIVLLLCHLNHSSSCYM